MHASSSLWCCLYYHIFFFPHNTITSIISKAYLLQTLLLSYVKVTLHQELFYIWALHYAWVLVRDSREKQAGMSNIYLLVWIYLQSYHQILTPSYFNFLAFSILLHSQKQFVSHFPLTFQFLVLCICIEGLEHDYPQVHEIAECSFSFITSKLVEQNGGTTSEN